MKFSSLRSVFDFSQELNRVSQHIVQSTFSEKSSSSQSCSFNPTPYLCSILSLPTAVPTAANLFTNSSTFHNKSHLSSSSSSIKQPLFPARSALSKPYASSLDFRAVKASVSRKELDEGSRSNHDEPKKRLSLSDGSEVVLSVFLSTALAVPLPYILSRCRFQ